MIPRPVFPSLTVPAAFGIGHWGLLVIVQLENWWTATGGVHPSREVLGTLLGIQGQNVIAALLMFALAWGAMRWTWARVSFFMFYALATLAVAFDPGYFRLFTDHYRLSLSEGVRTIDPTLGMSSITSAGSAAVAINFVLSLHLLYWLGVRWLGRVPPPVWRPRWAVLGGCSAALLALETSRTPPPVASLGHHPLYPLLQEALMPRVTVGLSAKAGDDTPIDAQPSREPALASVAAKIRAASPQPDIVFIILESVGAEPLLPLDPRQTPHLAALAQSAVLFDTLYAVFPGTARNHVAINTGGHQITWNSVYDTLHFDYTGPLMPRVFGTAGYQTALFSGERLDGEAMDEFERRIGWGTLYDFARDVKNHTGAKVLNSWGAKEETLLEVLTPWLDSVKRPFLLSTMNTATHHPYSVPRDYPLPFVGYNDLNRFRNALHYTDSAIGKLIEMLKARGLYNNTIIAITGDHGEAFGDKHPGNFTHKNAIYEENVHTFLLLAHPAIGETVMTARIGSSGDLFPTLAALCSVGSVSQQGGTRLTKPTLQVPGRDLLAAELPARTFHFTKCAFPEQWGLRDGRWKFIETIRERKAELFDLSTDPSEQRNVAATHADLVAHFSARCERWYLRTDADFTAQLAGYAAPALDANEVRSYGPKFITISGTPPVAETVWIPDGKPHDFTLVWQAPDGARHRADEKLGDSNYKTKTPCPVPAPLTAGTWTVSVEEGGRELTRTSFTVR